MSQVASQVQDPKTGRFLPRTSGNPHGGRARAWRRDRKAEELASEFGGLSASGLATGSCS